MGATPVPIPNTMVKTQAADDTALETVWESRWLPNPKKRNTRECDEYKEAGFTSDQRSKRFWFLMTDKTVKDVP